GLVCGIAFIRGLGGSTDFGNFYVDLTRAITRILLPLSILFGVLFVALGIPATFGGAVQATTLNGPLASPGTPSVSSSSHFEALGICLQGCAAASSPAPTATAQGQQNIARGLIAPLTAIKHLGTNGGG